MLERTARVCAAAVALSAGLACASTEQIERYRAQALEVARPLAIAATEGQADPVAGAGQLSRRDLVSQVLSRNPGLEASRAAWQAALARYPQVVSLPDPRLEYSVRPRSISDREVDPAHDVELSQPLPFPGKLGLRGEIALASADAAFEGVAAEQVRLASLASIAFDEYWLADVALATNAEHLAFAEELHATALARYATGTASQLEVLEAETEVAMLLHGEIELAAERRIAGERINLLLHREPVLPLPPPARELEAATEHDLDVDALVERALSRRPELRARAAETRANRAAVALAEREFLPDFELQAGYAGSMQESPLRPFLGIELELPIQLGRRRAALDEANALLARGRSRSRGLEDRVRFEVVVAIERLREAQHLLELSRERLLPAARDRAASARSAFQSGQAGFPELVSAERALRSAEFGEHEALANLSRRRAELSRTLGETAGLEEEKR